MTARAAVALCDHGFEAFLCRDEMPEALRADVDFAHTHAYAYAEALLGTADFPSRDEAEEFAAFVARGVARSQELDGVSYGREVKEWAAQR